MGALSKMYIGLHVKYTSLLPDVNENPSSVSLVVACREADKLKVVLPILRTRLEAAGNREAISCDVIIWKRH